MNWLSWVSHVVKPAFVQVDDVGSDDKHGESFPKNNNIGNNYNVVSDEIESKEEGKENIFEQK